MRLALLNEPDLEFGQGGTHIDVRHGIMQHGPFDHGTAVAPTQIKIGLLGTTETVEGIKRWLERCRHGLPAKDTRLHNLFPPFPGFTEDTCFRSALAFHPRWCGVVHHRDIEALVNAADVEHIPHHAVDLFMDHAADVVAKGGPDVFICAPPENLLTASEQPAARRADPVDDELDESADDAETVLRTGPPFHDLLKARAIELGTPIQMVRPPTYGRTPGKTKYRPEHAQSRPLQDEATRAWNFHVALYYKAGGIPWRLTRHTHELTTCYVGVSFYRSLDGDQLLTSVAQVFNERGEGMIVKGGAAQLDKDDRQPYLSTGDAQELLGSALDTYRREHKTAPARVVVHKTSQFRSTEIEGFRAAGDKQNIDTVDLLSVRRSLTRLFREGTYPPLRGTVLELGPAHGLIYLRGSVNFFEAYPGLYVPRPFEFQGHDTESSTMVFAEEIMALSKLNWNNTQFDGGEPMTVRAGRRVGHILKCVERLPEGAISFRFFM